jgi:hypothetical protein
MDKRKAQVPLVCHGHSRPIVDLSYSPITPDGFFLVSASKGMVSNSHRGHHRRHFRVDVFTLLALAFCDATVWSLGKCSGCDPLLQVLVITSLIELSLVVHSCLHRQ